MNCSFSLPGIAAIHYVAAAALTPNLALRSLATLPISLIGELMNIPFSGEPTCECTQTNEKNGTAETAELSFTSTTILPEAYHLAFVILDANGNYYLIGTKEEHPLIERVRSFGTPSGDPNTYTYTVKHTSPKALISLSLIG